MFTHLFHGGVILTTRKLEYDVTASEDVVKSLMQAQHKSILKGLKRGEFDGKIDAYLGSHPDLTAAGESGESGQPATEAVDAKPVEPGPAAADSAAAEPTIAEPPATPPGPTKPASYRPRRHSRPGTAGRTPIQPAPPPVLDTIRSGRQTGSVLVSAPPIVVDSKGTVPSSSSDPRRPARVVREEHKDSIFDQNLITEKSLDEVILAYLSEDSED